MPIIFKAGPAFLLAAAGLFAADALETKAWQTITDAIQAGGERKESALAMLGTIDNPTSRALIEATLKAKDARAISDVASGLTPPQCVFYLADLARAAQDVGVGPRLDILPTLAAIGRAGTGEAAEILIDIGGRAEEPIRGVAYGQLRGMGVVALPALIWTVANGRSAESRQIALEILGYTKDARVLAALHAALHDADGKVRTAAAYGLARLGHQDGKQDIEAAAADPDNQYYLMALVYLAALGRPEALEKLKSLVASPEEAVRGRTVWVIAQSGSARLKQFAYGLGLDRQPALRSMLVEKLLDPNDPQDLRRLREAMANGDEGTRLIAAERLLGTSHSDAAEPVIAAALGSNSMTGRQLAVKIASGQPALRYALAAQLGSSDPEVQMAALVAITDLREASRFREVAPYLDSERRDVSAAAARSLAALDPGAAKRVLADGLDSKNEHARIHSAAMLLSITAHARAGK